MLGAPPHILSVAAQRKLGPKSDPIPRLPETPSCLRAAVGDPGRHDDFAHVPQVAFTLAFRRDSTTDMIEEAIREVTEALRKADERVVYVYVRPSDKAERPRRKSPRR